ncbi:inorganic pyrophosphatase [Nitzschia inconspicua]|uniref:Inorganic pyrophosphatase n=1 Tax=Nitzschia inconspicua TaxID=303405 RepID=A0A9K3P9P7_9STRA|nr:inorganic pyrophosphatase [Nitzschia inconspicua]KAG7361197.1 inorganic pyrophosphatase [Nitzschia inconspicua]
MDEQLVPLNDDFPPPKAKPLTRGSSQSSFGSDKDIDLHHQGEEDTLDYRIHAKHNAEGKTISLWHDISLVHIDDGKTTEYMNFVCEIPKFTRKKYEIATDEDFTPIKQDEKKGKLREFKKGDIFFNYGCFPQTWEDPTFVHPDAEGCRGDNDPLDVCEIGARIIKCGGVRPVKVLGILMMIDEGEADWKIVVIDKDDKWAPFMNDINDVEEQLPGMLDAIREWYRTYKIPDGKPPNTFGLGERFMDKAYAKTVIDECHHAWEMLITGEKERTMGDSHDEEVKKLVRKLSKNSLSALVDNFDEHPDAYPHETDFDEEAVSF